MRSLDAGTLPRIQHGWVRFGLTSLLLCAACAPQDATAPGGARATPLSANLFFDPGPAFFVSPTGSPSGDGSFADPWDLATALNGPAAVTPGSTIWLRGGAYADGPFLGGYQSNLTGTPAAPIVVRQYPGEHATVTKFLVVQGAYTWYWGFEVVHTIPQVGSGLFGIYDRAPGAKLINLVVHDATGSGIFIGPEATDAEVYGSISYNNGRTDNLDHGIYCQSQSSLLAQDNIVFDNWAFGIHCFAKTGPYLQNITLEGNVAFNDYVWGAPSADIFVGGHFPATGIIIDQNYTYRSADSNTKAADIGYNLAVNQDLVLTNNYFVGGWLRMGPWAMATVSGNTLFNFTHGGMVWNLGDLSGQTWRGNTFFGDSTALAWRHDSSASVTFAGWDTLTGFTDPAGTYAGSAPAESKIVVRPNRYEPGRANIIVYNWAQQSTVSVDVAGILSMGDSYVVQNAQDFYGAPAASGVYTGDPLQLPMVGVTPPSPLETTPAQPAPVTGPTFNVFVLMTTGRGRCGPGEPGDPPGCGPPQ